MENKVNKYNLLKTLIYQVTHRKISNSVNQLIQQLQIANKN